MKKIVLVATLILTAALTCGAKPKEIKILYWNIQNGMWADQGNNYDNFVDFVKGQAPDICVWCEAESRYRTGTCEKMAGCEEAYLPWNWDVLARRYGHEYVQVCGKRDTFPQVITSKFPIRIVSRINGNGDDIIVVHGAGWAQIDLGGKTLNVVTVHTWPQKYAYNAEDTKASVAQQGGDVFRSVEMQYICEQTILSADPSGKDYWMMLGDFNAISSIDNYHYGLESSNKAFLVHDYIRTNTPYIDLIEKQYPGQFEHSTLSGRRIDFIYMTEPLYKCVKSAATIRDGFATSSRIVPNMHGFCTPSDHYPIVTVLKIR
ncbi:MAG: endonuclease [Bacteroidales bacterium]|nr:endonuclease [Bacteroidales bacterium]